MKRAYTDYCINNDRAEQLLEKYETVPEVQRLLQKGVETLQAQVEFFNHETFCKRIHNILYFRSHASTWDQSSSNRFSASSNTR